jgi:hypothetical protein
VAAIINSPGTGYLYALIRQKKFPAVHQGKYYKVSDLDLRGWIATHRQKIVDADLYATYNNLNEPKGASQDSQTARADATRIRGPRRRSTQFDSSARAGGNWHTRAGGTLDQNLGGATGTETQPEIKGGWPWEEDRR